MDLRQLPYISLVQINSEHHQLLQAIRQLLLTLFQILWLWSDFRLWRILCDIFLLVSLFPLLFLLFIVLENFECESECHQNEGVNSNYYYNNVLNWISILSSFIKRSKLGSTVHQFNRIFYMPTAEFRLWP